MFQSIWPTTVTTDLYPSPTLHGVHLDGTHFRAEISDCGEMTRPAASAAAAESVDKALSRIVASSLRRNKKRDL